MPIKTASVRMMRMAINYPIPTIVNAIMLAMVFYRVKIYVYHRIKYQCSLVSAQSCTALSIQFVAAYS